MSSPPPRVATYRLQLTPTFGFDAAADIVPYLADLGVSHLYLSPILEARSGSAHGYDQTDPSRVRREFGGEAALERLVRRVYAAGMGIVVDIVPNHMAASHENPLWFGLLKHGCGSEFDRYFDVDWGAAEGRIVLPVLGAPLSEIIARGELTMEDQAPLGPCVKYFDKLFPLRAGTDFAAAARSAAGLEAVLAEQHYELAFWREGLRKINYRRFFDVSDLAGIRVEDPDVFQSLHARIFELTARGWIDAIRVDHVDGLSDPLEYLQRLRSGLDAAAGRGRVWILVEKILGRDEQLPGNWPIDGTTGYEFLAAVTAMMVDSSGAAELRCHAVERLGSPPDFRALAVACKEQAARSILAPELARLARQTHACLDSAGIKVEPRALLNALVRLSASLDVYRTYADAAGMSPADAARVCAAGARAAELDATLRGSPLLDALMDLLTLSGHFAAGTPRAAALAVARAWQQFTGPLAAKGVEDTALYRDVACPALCDVGTEPTPSDAVALMRLVAEQRLKFPASLNATDTHDAKRSEDVRARLAALSRHARPWTELLDDVIPEFEAVFATERMEALSRRDLALILNAAIALWPNESRADEAVEQRLKAYVTKAVREAKLNTSWTDPCPDYERGCDQAIHMMLTSERFARPRERIADLVSSTRPLAARLSIAAIVLKSLLPGLPDWYQGAGIRMVSLVDPDNRRPVDFTTRERRLEFIRNAWKSDARAAASTFLSDADNDVTKLFITWRALAVRRHLLPQGGPVALQSLSVSNAEWVISVSFGSRVCHSRICLDPQHDNALRPMHTGADGIDQLTGQPHAAEPAWVSIVVAGESALLQRESGKVLDASSAQR